MSFFKTSPAKAGFFNASKPSFATPRVDTNVNAVEESHSCSPVHHEDHREQYGNSNPPLHDAAEMNADPTDYMGPLPIDEKTTVTTCALNESGAQMTRSNPIPQTPKGIGYRAKEKSNVPSVSSSLRGGTFPKFPSFGIPTIPTATPGKAAVPSSISRPPVYGLGGSSLRDIPRPSLSGQRQPLTDITPRQFLSAERTDSKTYTPIPPAVRQDIPERRLDDDVGKRVQELLTSVQELHDSVTESVTAHRIFIASIKTG